MTDTIESAIPLPRHWWSGAAAWWRAKDPGLLTAKRSVRAAVVVPLVFGVTHLLFTNPQIELFGAFGSFALLLLVDFPGRPRTRLVSYLLLAVVGVAFISVGTVVSTDKVLAVVLMAVVGFCVLFAGIVSPQAATASTGALLIFVLPVAVAQPASAVGPRLLGWVIAAAICISAAMLAWPTPWHDNLRRRLSATVSAISRLAAARADGRADPGAQAAVAEELSQLRRQFQATPYPPTGAGGEAVALAKLVGRVEWVASYAALASEHPPPTGGTPASAVIGAVATTLRHSASLICDHDAHPVDSPALVGAVEDSVRRLDQLISTQLDTEVSALIGPETDAEGTGPGTPPGVGSNIADDPAPTGDPGELASSMDPTFRARAVGIATEMVADASLEAAGAQAVGDRRLGPPSGAPARQLLPRITSHLSLRSVWFRNAVRGAAGLALAVGVVELTDVEHGFWVVLGTLSVLRSNALGTGATAVRAIAGTAVGFVVGSAIMLGVANHTVLLWGLLPLAVLVAGALPSIISFAAGQAAFSVVVIILFNIIDPTGWTVGLTRVEDVAIGCGVSIVVGLLFWPRGATAALGRALSDSFVASSGYLSDAVDRLTDTSRRVDVGPAERASHRAYLRLDDAFRQFLAERGAKVVPVAPVARLFTGSNRIRLAAYTLSTLPDTGAPGDRALESVTIAGAVLRDSYASSHRWYEEFAELLSARRDSLDPPPVHDATLHEVLRRALAESRAGRQGDGLRLTLRMLWADELLEAQSTVQSDLADSAAMFARSRRAGLMV